MHDNGAATRTDPAPALIPARPVEVTGPSPSACAEGSLPPPGQPGFLFFGAHRRSGTTWLTALLNAHPELHIRNEGWIFNDRGGSFETWFNRDRFNIWAAGREARGTWLLDIRPDDAARLMQQAMLRALFKEATVRQGWKDWGRLRWCGDKTTNFYNLAADTLFDTFPPGPPANGRFLSMVRDGRDVVVSNLFLLFREQGWADLPVETRPHALRAYEFHGKGRGGPVPLFSPALLRHLMTDWLRTVSGARRAAELYGPAGAFHEVRYESLIADTAGEVRRVYDWLGVGAGMSDEGLARVIEQCRFENFSEGRKRGQADPLAEWRKGVAGDWRVYFTEEDKRVFKAAAGSLLVDMGYERDMDW